MLRLVFDNLKACGRKLILADLVAKAVAFVLLTPLVGLLFRGFIAASGRTVLADTDIGLFLLHPIGMLAAVVLSSLAIAIFGIELGILITLSLATHLGRRISVRDSLQFVATRGAVGIIRLSLRVVLELVLCGLPFLAVGGGIFWIFLTDHDINFYLTTKPPKFFITVCCIGVVLACMAGVLIWRIANYIFATQILLFEKADPALARSLSSQRAVGHRWTFCKWLFSWAAINFGLGCLLTFVIGLVGKSIILWAGSNLVALAAAVGLAVGLVAIGNLLANSFANATLGSLLALTYAKHALPASTEPSLPAASGDGTPPFKLTRTRLVAGLVIGVLVAALFGGSVLRSFRLNDDVVITAHRGGATAAPENTMAAVESAIKLKADWVEIDVQESQDGVVLVVHDSDLKKIANNPSKIWEATATELQSVDIGSYFGSEFSDQRIPTLTEVLLRCKGHIKVNIELKYYGHDQDLEAKVVKLVEETGMQDDVVIMSLKQKGLDRIKKLRPDWTCGLLTAVASGDLTKADADFLAVNTTLATKPFIELAHRRGKDVAVWTLNDAISISRMLSRGADNIITDDVALVHRVLKTRTEMTPIDRLMLELAVFFGVDGTSQQWTSDDA